MDNQSKREARGYKIFAGLSLLIIVIGVVMMITNQYAVGTFGNGRAGTSIKSFSGFQTVCLGILMLLFVGGWYLADKKERRKVNRNEQL